jgi:hypothetical protein
MDEPEIDPGCGGRLGLGLRAIADLFSADGSVDAARPSTRWVGDRGARMEDGSERVDDDLEVDEVRYDPTVRGELPTSTPLTVVLPERWGDIIETRYAVQQHGPGYTVQAELTNGGVLGLWASARHGQPDEAVVLYDDAGLRATWSPDRLRARISVDDTSVFVVGDGIEVGEFETLLRSLRVVAR